MKKLIAGVLGLAVLVAVAAPVAQAQTTDLAALLAQLAQLQAQIAALQGGGASTGAVDLTVNLTIGSKGAQVTSLQNFLIGKGYSIPAGATGYFGAQTRAAVVQYQIAKGITPTAGYVGAITRAAIKADTASGPGPGPGPITPTACTDGTDGSLTVSLSTAATDATIKKGETKNMAAVKLVASAGKIVVSRVSVELSARPWIYFTQLVLKDSDGNVIATKPMSSSADAAEITVGSKYLVTFDGVNLVVEPGKDKTLVVSSTVSATTDKLTTDATVNVGFNASAIRYSNCKGFTDTTGLSGVGGTHNTDYRIMTLTQTGAGGNVVVRASAGQTARVQQTSTAGQTADAVLGSFELKAENADVQINTLKLSVKNNMGGAQASSTVFKTLELWDGTTVYNVDALDATSTFSNLTINLTKDTWKTLVVKADIADQDEFSNGVAASTTIYANTTDISGLDAAYNTASVTSSTSLAPNVTFLASGVSVSNISVQTPQAVDNGSSAVTTYRIGMTFTLNNTGNNDVYVSKTVSTALATSSSGTATTTQLTQVDVTGNDNANDTSSYWVISPGAPRTFTYQGTINVGSPASMTGLKTLSITKIYFDDDTTGLQEFNIDFGITGLKTTVAF